MTKPIPLNPTRTRAPSVVVGIAPLVTIALVLWTGSPAVAAPAPAAKPARITAATSCVSASCHTNVAAGYEFEHWPRGKGKCRTCHEPQGGAHVFKTKSSLVACAACHTPVNTKANVHFPVDDDCYECHMPHGSNTRGLLKKPAGELCFDCHERTIMAGKFQHGPAAAGDCTMCHDPHGSDQEATLKYKGVALCGQCHEQLAERLAAATEVHKPAADGCTGCHNPHSGPYPKMLPGKGAGLCAKCHDKVVAAADAATTKHKPVMTGQRCGNCHTPHATSSSPLLRKPQVDLCLGCHDKPRKKGKHTLPSMKKLLADNKDWHGPIRKGNCAGCHQPHGSSSFRLLKKDYPAKFYDAFDPDNYALCFGCHEPDMVAKKTTSSLTNFRDGRRNLHYLHVNKKRRGRTCRACHQVHASNLPKHIREGVPYGAWMLPIRYTKKRNGGTCEPGCHKPVTYVRSAAPSGTKRRVRGSGKRGSGKRRGKRARSVK